MRTIDEWLALYARDHQNPLNKRIHWVCVPVIFYTIIGLLSCVPMPWSGNLPWLNLGWFAVVFSLVFYFRLSLMLALGFLIVGIAVLGANWWLMVQLGTGTYAKLLLAAFVIAWIFQFIGHKAEGQKPAFFEDLQFLLIGPAWVLAYIYDQLGINYKKTL